MREMTGATRGWFAFGDTAFARLRLDRGSHTAVVLGVNEPPHESEQFED